MITLQSLIKKTKFTMISASLALSAVLSSSMAEELIKGKTVVNGDKQISGSQEIDVITNDDIKDFMKINMNEIALIVNARKAYIKMKIKQAKNDADRIKWEEEGIVLEEIVGDQNSKMFEQLSQMQSKLLELAGKIPLFGLAINVGLKGSVGVGWSPFGRGKNFITNNTKLGVRGMGNVVGLLFLKNTGTGKMGLFDGGFYNAGLAGAGLNLADTVKDSSFFYGSARFYISFSIYAPISAWYQVFFDGDTPKNEAFGELKGKVTAADIFTNYYGVRIARGNDFKFAGNPFVGVSSKGLGLVNFDLFSKELFDTTITDYAPMVIKTFPGVGISFSDFLPTDLELTKKQEQEAANLIKKAKRTEELVEASK